MENIKTNEKGDSIRLNKKISNRKNYQMLTMKEITINFQFI